MKSILILTMTLISTQSFATGTLFCESKDQSFSVEGSVARMYGDPLVGSLYVKAPGAELEIKKDQVINYWSDGDEVKLLALDSDFNLPVLKLETKKRFGKLKGKATFNNKSFKVECFY